MTPNVLSRRDLLRLIAASGGLLTGAGLEHAGRVNAQGGVPDWALLQKRVRGRVTASDGEAYERQRRAMVWNAIKPERFPAAIVHAESEADVREAIRFARARHLQVAIRGGGHNWHNAAIRQGGLLLDLSGLNQVQVDPAARTAAVQPGVMGAVLIGKLAPHGLAFPVANGAQVGLSGFLLNGGLGRNFRVWGPSCGSVEAIEMVDARGEWLRADENENTELFWAARGAGPGFFGVVTRFFLRAYPMPRAMMRATASYAIEDGDKLAAWLTDLPLAPPAHVNCSLVNGGWRITAIAFTDTESQGRDVLHPFDNEPAGLKPLTKNLYQPMSVEAVFGSASEPFKEGPRYIGDSMVSNASPRDLMSAVREAARTAPAGSAFSFVSLERPDGGRQPDMAFSIAASRYVHAHGLWRDAALDALNHAWVRSTIASVEPFRTGYYVGEADLSVTPERAKQCFSPSNWDRLIRLKRKYDPEDLFFSYLTS